MGTHPFVKWTNYAGHGLGYGVEPRLAVAYCQHCCLFLAIALFFIVKRVGPLYRVIRGAMGKQRGHCRKTLPRCEQLRHMSEKDLERFEKVNTQ